MVVGRYPTFVNLGNDTALSSKNIGGSLINISLRGSGCVRLLVEWSLLMQEVRDSNPVISEIL